MNYLMIIIKHQQKNCYIMVPGMLVLVWASQSTSTVMTLPNF